MTPDSGSIVLGWLTKLAATIAFFGVIAFDGIGLVTSHVQAADHANSAALLAADDFRHSKDAQSAYDAAVAAADEHGEVIDADTFTVDEKSGVVSLTLHREATTLWLHRIGPLKKYVDVTSTAQGSPGR